MAWDLQEHYRCHSMFMETSRKITRFCFLRFAVLNFAIVEALLDLRIVTNNHINCLSFANVICYISWSCLYFIYDCEQVAMIIYRYKGACKAGARSGCQSPGAIGLLWAAVWVLSSEPWFSGREDTAHLLSSTQSSLRLWRFHKNDQNQQINMPFLNFSILSGTIQIVWICRLGLKIVLNKQGYLTYDKHEKIWFSRHLERKQIWTTT